MELRRLPRLGSLDSRDDSLDSEESLCGSKGLLESLELDVSNSFDESPLDDRSLEISDTLRARIGDFALFLDC